MGKMQEKREAKRLAILNAAREEFLTAGYEPANMDRIAALAQVTKQTVYRYFPSKIELFEATVRFVGEASEASFTRHLDNPDAQQALIGFAEGFIRWHLQDEPLRVFRLLIAESARSPEVVDTFFAVAPDETNAALTRFFRTRLGVAEPEEAIFLWASMLSAFRDDVLLGRGRPDDERITWLAKTATRVLLAEFSNS